MAEPSRSSATTTAAAVIALLGAVVGFGAWLNGPVATTADDTRPGPGRTAAPIEREAAASTPPEAPPEPDKPAPDPPDAASLEDVIGRVMPAVVLVETSSARGSAFFVSSDTLLTNVHVVANNASVTIQRMNGSREPARVAALAPDFDIAVLKVSSAAPDQAVITMGSVQRARVGQEVIAIGSALGTLQNTVTRGIVSAVRQGGNATLVQTDAAVNPGNSGGPLLDRAGAAIGITTMGYRNSQGLNFAVAIDHARALLDGRSGTFAAAALNPPDVLNVTPAIPSESDRARSDGQQNYERALAAIAQRADALDQDWGRFRSSCYQSPIAGAFGREWIAVLDPRAMRDPVPPQCGTFLGEIKHQAELIHDALTQVDEAARRAGVYPGVRRDMLQKYRLAEAVSR